ncbi:MAG: DUF481 domain-containing protein [bacterium]
MRTWMCFIFMLMFLTGVYGQEKKRDIQLELSYVKTGGNTDTETFSSKLDAEGTGLGNRYFLTGMLLRTKDDGKEKTNNFTSGLRIERTLSGRLFAFIGIHFIRDRFEGYEYRFSVGPGMGFDILRGERHTMKGLCSILYYRDKTIIQASDFNVFASLKPSLQYEWKIKKDVIFKNHLGYNWSLKQREKYFVFMENSLQIGLSGRISIGIGYLLKYQNLVPAPEIKKTDTSLLTSLIVHFSRTEK